MSAAKIDVRALVLLVAVAYFITAIPLSAEGGTTTPNSFSLLVPAGQWKGVRLKDLPKDVLLALAVQSDGPLTVGFVDSRDQAQFPQIKHPLFWGQLESKLGFSVTIQTKGDYHVILDNREGTVPRKVNVTAKATLGGAAAQALMAEQIKKVELQLRTLEQKLNQTFTFTPIPLQVRPCHRSQSFQRTDGLILCLEYARHLMDTFQDKTQASDALVFSLFQEMAQLFQSQWALESSDPATMIDELTTVLMLTFRLDANARAYSQIVINQPSLTASLIDLFNDPLHPLSADRAHRVLKWATDPDLVRRWQIQLVPHMQTRMLQHLKQHPQPWSDSTLIEQELDTRQAAPFQERSTSRPKIKA